MYRSSLIQPAVAAFLARIGILAVAAMQLTGCVTPIPVSEQNVIPSYVVGRPILISVVDARPEVREGKPANFIGKMHLTFGIPADMAVYPVISEDKKYKDQSLAAALEERIADGVAGRGWQATAAGLASRPVQDDIPTMIDERNTEQLLLLTLEKWFVSINLNWVSAFNFDWAVRVEVFDKSGTHLADYRDSGRDIVDEEHDQSPGNHIRLAYKERLTKILEDPRLRAVLHAGSPEPLSQR